MAIRVPFSDVYVCGHIRWEKTWRRSEYATGVAMSRLND
jgi:hypothetical protein